MGGVARVARIAEGAGSYLLVEAADGGADVGRHVEDGGVAPEGDRAVVAGGAD